ncbi:hypothetical protein KEM56_005009, partial [Ascosphaera pollenicola]
MTPTKRLFADMDVRSKQFNPLGGSRTSKKRAMMNESHQINQSAFNDVLSLDTTSSISSITRISCPSETETTPNTTLHDESICTNILPKPALTGPDNAANDVPSATPDLFQSITVRATIDGALSTLTEQSLNTSKRTAQHIIKEYWKSTTPPGIVDYNRRLRPIHGTRSVNALMGHITPGVTVKPAGWGCYRCETGNGPFTTCIVHPYPTFAKNKGACTGCLFDGVGARCSLAENTRTETDGRQWRKDTTANVAAPMISLGGLTAFSTSAKRMSAGHEEETFEQFSV